MAEIGKAHDAHAPHASGFTQHHFGIAKMLQGLQLQDHIEAVVTEHSQPLFEVELNDIHAALHAGLKFGVIEFNTIAAAAFFANEQGQQLTFAAAQIQHP